jgi:transcriptional regulator with XRE-family HTH domain
MGFEDDFNRIFDEVGISRTELARRVESSPAYVSKVLNGTAGNFKLITMAKWARAIGAIVQIRLIKEGKEVVRTLDYETASKFDDDHHSSLVAIDAAVSAYEPSNVVNLEDYARARAGKARLSSIGSASIISDDPAEENYG